MYIQCWGAEQETSYVVHTLAHKFQIKLDAIEAKVNI